MEFAAFANDGELSNCLDKFTIPMKSIYKMEQTINSLINSSPD